MKRGRLYDMRRSAYVYDAFLHGLREQRIPPLFLGLIERRKEPVKQRAFHWRMLFRRKRTVIREVAWDGYERQPWADLTQECTAILVCGGDSQIIGVVGFDAPSGGHRMIGYVFPDIQASASWGYSGRDS